jgi:2-dehydro-3-deoxyphosphogluconate aldolase/(4S)-4-hydroxy-2-oxoglutarate aldolase
MMQNNIENILKNNPLIPVVTIESLDEIEGIYKKLVSQNVRCIEITLRTDVAWEAISVFKTKYGSEFKIGVGTIICVEDILKCIKMNVDFMVSPGYSTLMVEQFEISGIPFLPGVSTPGEITQGIENGWRFFKFFPADLFGGINALKTYGNVFQNVKFCPTGGINQENHLSFLALENVLSVGGSWLLK